MSAEPGAHRTVPRGYVYADHIPYDTPDSLDDLRGPRKGVVRVGPPISTAPDPVYDLSDEDMVWHLYSAVVREGNARDHEALLERRTLIRLWPELNLPARCRAVWEAKFPVLAARTARTA
ncbi:hypothetical protein ACFT2C_24410 [Promicromonospora sp. NPDC057138]|uniref:hypothetical protein n=1 Tax=Promicromonospora sp. NPDC057138 TaxID=3346031 RepID=UPI00363ED073